mgnify:CR=1 FL=1
MSQRDDFLRRRLKLIIRRHRAMLYKQAEDEKKAAMDDLTEPVGDPQLDDLPETS